MKQKRKRCPHCRKLFTPDHRNIKRQRFCCQTVACRKASKKDSQQRWLNKPENRDYFRSRENCDRVRDYRARHPDRCRKKSPPKKRAVLQDDLTPQHTENNGNTARLEPGLLQDIIQAQPYVILGLIANITGTALQDNMAITVRRLLNMGLDIASQPITGRGEHHDIQRTHHAPAHSQGAPAVQLAGSQDDP